MLALLRHHLIRVGPWPRRVLALAFLALAAITALDAHAATPGAEQSERVVVAGRDLPAGHVLAGRDLMLRSWPRSLAPPGRAATPRALVGRRLAGPLARGEPVTTRRLVGRDLTSGLSPDEVATMVTLDDPHAAELVHPGDRVDVLAVPRPDTGSDDSSGYGSGGSADVRPAVVVAGVRVLAVLTTSDPDADGNPAEVVVATTRDIATRLAGVSSSDSLTIVGRSP